MPRLATDKYVTDLPREDDAGSNQRSFPIPRLPRRIKFRRKYERPNYIPHTTPVCTDPKAWCYTYADPLQEMYRVTRLIIKAKYPYTKIDWDDPIYANALSKMIYHCSSKYISPFMEEYSDEENVQLTSKSSIDSDKGWEKQKGN